MSEQDVTPLIPGDTLTLGFEFEHAQHLEEVISIFGHKDHPNESIVLTADQHDIEKLDNLTTVQGGRAFRSAIHFEYPITASLRPGEYVFRSLEFRTSGKNSLVIPDEFNPLSGMAYVVGSEPEYKPLITKLLAK